jgi:RNA polymerase sigma factor (sigma-70 family)
LAGGVEGAQWSDDQLVERSQAGDEQAFAELYERYQGELYDFAVRIVRDRDAAADVVQGTFAKAWPALQAGKPIANVRAWLFAVARNASIDELRHHKRLVRHREEDAGVALGLAAIPPDPEDDPTEAVERKELAELVWTSAAALSAKEYSLLDLHVRRGLDADEVASSLGLRRGAVYTRLTRLRNALEAAVTTTLVVRTGRDDCAELDGLAARLGVGPEQVGSGDRRLAAEG